jgi:tripeptide aminopeptidase
MMINRDRLAEIFKCLVEIDSVSRAESAVCSEIRQRLELLGAKTVIDNSASQTGSDTGNLIAFFEGCNSPAAPLLLNAHMDTVEPGNGIKAVLQDGVFTSAGDTILGADDKSAIAILLETMNVLKENHLNHAPLELVFTTCEEVGLLGALHLDSDRIQATMGYALDASDINGIITRAPSACWFEFKIHGKSAHAGAAPEKGINAIAIASKAIASLEIGRIDHETTTNIGVIKGGLAANIVPDRVTVIGEVRSHDSLKLRQNADIMIQAFKDAVKAAKKTGADSELPYLTVDTISDFPGTKIPDNHPIVMLAVDAAQNLGRSLEIKSSGGCADANIFFQKGLAMGVLGTGMRNMHTVRETVGLDDMISGCQLLIEIIQVHSKTMRSE